MIIGFDLETTSPRRGKHLAVQECQIIGYSVSWSPNQGVYVSGPPGVFMKGVLEDSRITKVCHNSKFEYSVLRNHGIELVGFEDTKLAAYLLGYHTTHLKVLARQLLGREPITYEQVTQGGEMSDLSPEEIVDYAAADADNTRRLWLEHLEPALRKEPGLMETYQHIERPLVPVLGRMEQEGIGVDEERTKRLWKKFGEMRNEEVQVVEWMLGIEGLTNPKLAKALEVVGAPIKKRTEGRGWMATDEDTLEEIRAWWPELIGAIIGKRGNLEQGEDKKVGGARGLEKLAGYMKQFIELRGPDGRLHTSFNQAGHWEEVSEPGSDGRSPVTGRLSSSGPNLQQVPHHVGEGIGKEVRKCLVARDGCVLVSADIEQEEPRIVALVAPEEQMQRDFDAGVPIYGPMGEAVYGYEISKKDNPHEWFVAKTFFLAVLYGANWTKLQEIDPQLSRARAKRGWERLHERYPGISRFRQATIEEAQQGHVTDWFGRKRWIAKVWSGDKLMREAGYREAVNMKIQGPAASVMKLALLKVDRELGELEGRLLLAVHDEVVIECREEAIDKVMEVCYSMTEGLMPIKLPVEVKVGRSWGELA